MNNIVIEKNRFVNFKFNWGWGIALFIGAFVISMLMMVFSTFDHRWELVTEDYYEKDLKFDQKAEKIRNASAFVNSFSVAEMNFQQIEFEYKDLPANVQGNIQFFRPSNAALDFQVPLTLGDEMKQTVKSPKLQSGKWNIIFEWQDKAGKEFYHQKVVVIP